MPGILSKQAILVCFLSLYYFGQVYGNFINKCYFKSLSFGRSSLIVQLVENPPAMQETPIQFLGWEDPLEKG